MKFKKRVQEFLRILSLKLYSRTKRKYNRKPKTEVFTLTPVENQTIPTDVIPEVKS